jgi:putative hydrolase of the HAD superfamily
MILLIDLDDTLYDESDYVRSGFRAVSPAIARMSGFDSGSVSDWMVERFEHHGREAVFDHALEHFGVGPDPELVRRLMTVYRSHRPDIHLYPGVADVLRWLAETHTLALVTDGLPLMQRRKVEALELEDLFPARVYCWELGAPKPALDGYREALRRLPDSGPALVIGDNPAHDMAAARELGLPCMRVRQGRFANRPNPHGVRPIAEIPRFTSIRDVLRV